MISEGRAVIRRLRFFYMIYNFVGGHHVTLAGFDPINIDATFYRVDHQGIFYFPRLFLA
jgi:hypothetical protein